ncbi:MAG: 4-(cytidine 5'-diphospho)-2-C-methyl-D-erythritol kinase [Treponema sp.]|nr:4-(cytidine 5'-diphospho)-2-C-methyl-D-erythritol kinase [Treponema sp.]
MNYDFSVKAYAKVNFGLKVLPKRQDGFHNIESIFQTVDLYDQLNVALLPTNECRVTCNSMSLPEDNTLVKAYKAFVEVSNCSVPGVDVELVKGIPSGGGLGGGSSDAAALVRVLEKSCDVLLSESQFDYIASKTGSDVFFFMHSDEEGKACAVVSGRGEIVRRIKPRHDLFLLLVFPNVSSSTKEAYSLVDDYLAARKMVTGTAFSNLESVYNRSVEEWNFVNTFTPVITETYPKVRDALDLLKQNGAPFAEMSGSGSTVYGVFTLQQQAEEVQRKLAGVFDSKLVQTV